MGRMMVRIPARSRKTFMDPQAVDWISTVTVQSRPPQDKNRSATLENGGDDAAGQAFSRGSPDWMNDLNSRVAMIQALIPIALQRVQELLAADVNQLAGPRYRHGGSRDMVRWGRQKGSVWLGEQKVSLQVPRVRDLQNDQEVPLPSYRALREPRRAEEAALHKVLKGLSCRDYGSCVEGVGETFGLSSSAVSRRFKEASARQLRTMAEGDLSEHDLVALFLDGKTFGQDTMVIALGITLSGRKVPLGFVQANTENHAVCADFLRRLVQRGLKFEQGLLCVIDGGKGLRKAVEVVFGVHAVVQRCQWHKRENVVSYLPTTQRKMWRHKIQQAYQNKTYAAARGALTRLRCELMRINESAAASLDEGLEETLTLHRLKLFGELGHSFKTTNCIESINALVEQRTGKVDYWKNSNQCHRWLAAALNDVTPRLNDVSGRPHLPRLRAALQEHIQKKSRENLPLLGAVANFN